MKLRITRFPMVFCGILSFCLMVRAQNGCTDPQAQNFDPNATLNDGSCLYPTTNYTLQLVSNLSNELNENSGLIFESGLIYSHNDSGGTSEIFELDSNGVIQRNIFLAGMNNIDWEAISSSGTEIFLGDVGNNQGNRTDLKIIRISKDSINSDTITPNQFYLTYSNQTDFTNVVNQHNFDCEAFIYHNDSLHLFTKGWQNLYTKHYVMAISTQDTVEAILRDSMFVDGLITDATIDTTTGRVFLLGYKNNGSNYYTSFVYLLFDFFETNFFKGNKRRIEIGNVLTVGQTEGITLKNGYSGYISSERVTSSLFSIEPKLFKFNFSNYFDNPSLNIQESKKHKFMIYPNPVKEVLHIESNNISSKNYYQITDCYGRKINSALPLIANEINLSTVEKGFYYLQIFSEFENVLIPFIKE